MADRERAQVLVDKALALAVDRSNPANNDEAWRLLCSAVTVDPTFGLAWCYIADGCVPKGMYASAVTAAKRALECEDIAPELRMAARVKLGNWLHYLGRNGEARSVLKKVIRENDNIAGAWINLSLVESVDGQLDLSLGSAVRGYTLNPGFSPGETALAFALMYAGRYAEGLQHFEARWIDRLPHVLKYPYPKWQGEHGDVWVISEQGIGDALSFSRFVLHAAKKAKSLYLTVQPALYRLFAMAFANLKNVTVAAQPQPFPAVDYWSSFVSLPTALGLTNEEIINAPDIPVPALSMASTWKSNDAKLHIGVAWRGAETSDFNHYRSFPFHELLKLYDVPGVQLYSLQADDRSIDLYEQGAAGMVRDLKPYLTDIAATMALIKDLDLIITVESALGHIAALAGKECFIPYSWLRRDFRLGHDGSRRLWTPHTKVFKQSEAMTWPPVFERIVEAVRSKMEKLP